MTFLDPIDDQPAPVAADQRPSVPVFRGVQIGDSRRWHDLARAAGLRSDEPLLLALSGGADSVFLLQVLAAAQPRPDVLAVHVNHGLRGDESEADADFCRRRCAELAIPLVVEKVDLSAGQGSLEERARCARYGVLGAHARNSRPAHGKGKPRVVLTGHHADDALETLLWRWTRGSAAPGLRPPLVDAPLPQFPERAGDGSPVPPEDPDQRERTNLRVVRPLAHLRRDDLRAWLLRRDLPWREDSSNRSGAHTRNRIRNGFVSLLSEIGGEQAIENLHAFGREIEALEARLAPRIAELQWEPLPGIALEVEHSSPNLPPRSSAGQIARSRISRLPHALRRRGLWRLLREGTGKAPGARLLERLLDDLDAGRTSRHSLPGGASLHLRSRVLVLTFEENCTGRFLRGKSPQSSSARNASSPRTSSTVSERPIRMRSGQTVRLPDGLELRLERTPSSALAADPSVLEFTLRDMPGSIILRRAREGDRFHALGAPGSKRLVRFLADRGVPRSARPWVWVLVHPGDGKLLGVLGHGPADGSRVRVGQGSHWRLAPAARAASRG